LTEESIVLDVGGYVGDFAARIYDTHGCYVYVYEPSQRYYDELLRRFNGNSKIAVFHYGLGYRDGHTFIRGSGDALSIHNGNATQETVLIKDAAEVLDHLKKHHGVHSIDLMKLNAEGSEFEILPRLVETSYITRIGFLQIQYHDFYPNSRELAAQITLELEKTHNIMWNYPFTWESWSKKNS